MRARRVFRTAPLLALAFAIVVVVTSCGSGTGIERAAPAAGLKRVVVGDLSVRVPAEWRSYDYDFGAGWEGVSLADPRHDPSDAVIFGLYSQPDPGLTAAEIGKGFGDAVKGEAGSSARGRSLVLPSGISAYEVRYELDGDRAFTGLAYALVTRSGSGTRGYLVMYRAAESQAGHMAQFRTSAGSIRATVPGPPPVATAESASKLKRVVVGGLSIGVPVSWQSVSLPSGVDGVVMGDPPGLVTFMWFYFDLGMTTTAAEWGSALAPEVRDDPTLSVTGERLVTLPSGIPAYEVRYTREDEGETVTGVEYTVVTHGTTVHTLTYETSGSQARLAAQVRASAQSIRRA